MYDVCIVITTRNEVKHIENCLKSVVAQDYPQDKIEIIVVDNNSTDKTKEIALGFTSKVYNHGPERSAQRNLGISKAQAEYVLYLDADMSLSQNVIKECTEKCEREKLDALYIPEKITGKGFWIKVRDFERSFYNATIIDCVRFLKKEKFLEIGGFDENLTGPEDWDFDRRIRAIGKAGVINAPIYHNEDGFNLKTYIKKKIYYGASFEPYKDKWGPGDTLIKEQLGLRRCRLFFEHGKWLRLMRHPILTLAMLLLVFLKGITYRSKER